MVRDPMAKFGITGPKINVVKSFRIKRSISAVLSIPLDVSKGKDGVGSVKAFTDRVKDYSNRGAAGGCNKKPSLLGEQRGIQDANFGVTIWRKDYFIC